MRATNTTNLLELQEWCRKFDAWTPHQWDTRERFLIGLYQIPGYNDWGDSRLNKWESLASCMIHLLIVAERMKLGVEEFVHRDLRDIETWTFSAEQMMSYIGKIAQHLIYGHPRNKAARAKRYDQHKLKTYLSAAIMCCMAGIPSESRGLAIQDATLIMTGKL